MLKQSNSIQPIMTSPVMVAAFARGGCCHSTAGERWDCGSVASKG